MALNPIHRTIGKFQKRTEDNVNVGLVITEFQQTEDFTEKIFTNTKAWRDAWTDILVFQTQIAASYETIYQNAPSGESNYETVETPLETLERIGTFHNVLDDLRVELGQDLKLLESTVIDPLCDIKKAFIPIHKAMKKRENKKLDFERHQKTVDHQRTKRNRNDRENKILSKAERELELAIAEYQNHDERLIEWLPPLIRKIAEALPLILEGLMNAQIAMLARTYTVYLEYAQQSGLDNYDRVVEEWEEVFSPMQRHVETNLVLIQRGNAVKMSMSQLSASKTSVLTASLPSRLKRGAPPPPPSNPPSSHVGGARPAMSRVVSSPSSTNGREDISPRPPPPGLRPLVSRASTTNLRKSIREESPPPPLPGNKPPPPVSPQYSRPNTAYSTASNGSSVREPPPPAPPQFGVRKFSNNSQLSIPGQQSNTPAQPEWPRLRPTTSNSNISTTSRDSREGIHRASNTVSAFEASSQNFSSARSQFSSGYSINNNSNNSNNQHNGAASQLNSTKQLHSSIERSLSAQMGNGVSKPNYASSIASNTSTNTTATFKKKPPPPPPKKREFTIVTALYNFDGQNEGDLAFRAGDRIKVVKKTESMDDWWEGELDGRRGEFPANYTMA